MVDESSGAATLREIHAFTKKISSASSRNSAGDGKTFQEGAGDFGGG